MSINSKDLYKYIKNHINLDKFMEDLILSFDSNEILEKMSIYYNNSKRVQSIIEDFVTFCKDENELENILKHLVYFHDVIYEFLKKETNFSYNNKISDVEKIHISLPIIIAVLGLEITKKIYPKL